VIASNRMLSLASKTILPKLALRSRLHFSGPIYTQMLQQAPRTNTSLSLNVYLLIHFSPSSAAQQHLPTSHLRLTALPAILLPIHPAPLILRNILIPNLLRQRRSRRAPDARFAVENQFFVHRGFAETEAVFELFFGQEHGVRLGFYGDVERAGDEAC
jgi:hypothetical protein